jgi:copper oxidase (laccase) domain-containing protein
MKKEARIDRDCIPVAGVVSGVSTRHSALYELCLDLDLPEQPIVRMHQTHSINVARWSGQPTSKEIFIPDMDGIFTTEKNVVLAVKTADCLPLLLYHPSGLVGAVHVGRKGCEDGILGALFSGLFKETQLTSGFIFYLGPCICQSCYQIDREKNIYYDLPGKVRSQIKSLWPDSRIYESESCTSCEVDRYFSYRRELGTQQRFFSVISMV